MKSIETLDLADAKLLCGLAMARHAELPDDKRKPISVAIVDSSGHLIYFERQDGASADSVKFAAGKAVTAVRCRKDTVELRHRRPEEGEEPGWKLNQNADVRDGIDRATIADYDFVSFAGGVYAQRSGLHVFGGIGVSGLDQLDDHQVARGAVHDFCN